MWRTCVGYTRLRLQTFRAEIALTPEMRILTRLVQALVACAAALCGGLCPAVQAEPLDAATIAAHVEPPYQLSENIGTGMWEIVNLDGRLGGYVIETEPNVPIPGFSGAPINLLVTIDLQGRFIDAELLSHNEPIFVSGLGEAPFHEFVAQYRGHSIRDSLVVGVPYGKDSAAGGSLVYLDGVTKATASVRIAHETILAAAFRIARDRMQGVAAGPPARPDPGVDELLDWADLVELGIATRRLVTNAEVDAAFAGTLWADDDPVARADPDGAYLDLWVVDLGPPSVARAVLDAASQARLSEFLSISTQDEPILVIDAGRHGLVTEDFTRNTSPDLISASQDGLPVALRDSDLEVGLAPGVPGNVAMIMRTDRRLGFDPTREWTLTVQAVREHGSFMPEAGVVAFTATHEAPERFFVRDLPPEPLPAWLEALRGRAVDLVILVAFLVVIIPALLFRQSRLAGAARFTALRLSVLAVVIGFVGWWGQGQLSITTVLGVLRGLVEGQSLAFLLYDPFSLLIWAAAILGFVLWGRGLFCGWLCPFGAMQEFAHHLGRRLSLPQLRVPRAVDRVLVWLKYVLLAGLVLTALINPALNDLLIEVEPFKTAVTVYFVREWYFVLYAVAWLALGMVLFKGFCRYVCPLGALMALGGLLRRRDWIARRVECGSPCQLCRVRCNYRAIRPEGSIDYSECFQCLDCVTIHDDPKTCVPLVLATRERRRA